MKDAEAYRLMYGAVPQMRLVLEQRRGLVQDALAMTQDLRRRLHDGFPPVDSIGGGIDTHLKGSVASLTWQLREIEAAMLACAPPDAPEAS